MISFAFHNAFKSYYPSSICEQEKCASLAVTIYQATILTGEGWGKDYDMAGTLTW